jgi:hypothetical protein
MSPDYCVTYVTGSDRRIVGQVCPTYAEFSQALSPGGAGVGADGDAVPAGALGLHHPNNAHDIRQDHQVEDAPHRHQELSLPRRLSPSPGAIMIAVSPTASGPIMSSAA